MNEINNFLEFLYDNIEDDRIEVSKKLKYGFRHYYINLCVQIEKDNGSRNSYTTYSMVRITIDNRNKCIELEVDMNGNIIFEDEKLVSKWSDLLEKYITDNIESRTISMIDNVLSNALEKDLIREYKMRKITKKQ